MQEKNILSNVQSNYVQKSWAKAERGGKCTGVSVLVSLCHKHSPRHKCQWKLHIILPWWAQRDPCVCRKRQECGTRSNQHWKFLDIEKNLGWNQQEAPLGFPFSCLEGKHTGSCSNRRNQGNLIPKCTVFCHLASNPILISLLWASRQH